MRSRDRGRDPSHALENELARKPSRDEPPATAQAAAAGGRAPRAIERGDLPEPARASLDAYLTLHPRAQGRMRDDAEYLLTEYPITKEAVVAAWTASGLMGDGGSASTADGEGTRSHAFAALWLVAQERGPISAPEELRAALGVPARERERAENLELSRIITLSRLRALPEPARAEVLERACRIVEDARFPGFRSSDFGLQAAIVALKREPSRERALTAMEKALCASMLSRPQYIERLADLSAEKRGELEALVAQARLQYGAVRNSRPRAAEDFVRASADDVVLGTDASRRRAEVLALLVNELDARDVPRRSGPADATAGLAQSLARELEQVWEPHE